MIYFGHVDLTVSKVEASNSPAEASPVFVEVVVPWLFGLICVVGLVGNALVVVVVACNPQMRSTTNMLIINLAIADLLFIVFCVPFTAIDYSIGKLTLTLGVNCLKAFQFYYSLSVYSNSNEM